MSVVLDCVRNSGVPQHCSYPDTDGGSDMPHDTYVALVQKQAITDDCSMTWSGAVGGQRAFSWVGAEEKVLWCCPGAWCQAGFWRLAFVVRWRVERQREFREKLGVERYGRGLGTAWCVWKIMGWHYCWCNMYKVGCGGDKYHQRSREGLSMEGLLCFLDKCKLVLGVWPVSSASWLLSNTFWIYQ